MSGTSTIHIDEAGKDPHWSGDNWFAVPTSLHDTGVLASLSRAQRATLDSLFRHAKFTVGTAYPGVKVIVRETNLCRRTVERALKALEGRGLITLAEQGGGRCHANVYRLQIQTANPGPQTDVSNAQTPVVGDAKTPVAQSINPGQPVHKPRSADRPNKGNKEKNTSSNKPPYVAACINKLSIIEETNARILRRIGIAGDETITQLAQTPDLTPAAIAMLAGSASPKVQNLAGMVRTAIEKGSYQGTLTAKAAVRAVTHNWIKRIGDFYFDRDGQTARYSSDGLEMWRDDHRVGVICPQELPKLVIE